MTVIASPADSADALPDAKLFFDGAHRARPPSETLDRLRPLFPIFGITRLADLTGLDRVGIPVTAAYRPNARSLAVSQGKGRTLDAALASAMMESIEVFHAEHITVPLKFASFEELRYSHPMVYLDRLPRVQGRTFEARQTLLWIEGKTCRQGFPCWVPFEMVHTNYTRPMPPGSGVFIASSNGLASGNTKDEAVCHALCEVIERDAVALWSQSGEDARAARRLDMGTIDEPGLHRLIDRFDAADIDLAIWDVTSDTEVPAYLVWTLERGNLPILLHRPSVGAGCHPNRAIALSRALTEAAQERLTLISGARDDLDRDFYQRQSFRDVFDAKGFRSFAATPGHHTLHSGEDVGWVLSSLARLDLPDPVVIDLTSDLVERHISVVRVVAPGLESAFDDDRYQPGRRARALKSAP